jgi:hypothetical protein
MHDANLMAAIIFRFHVAGVGNTRFLNDRQCIHISSDKKVRARTVLEDADNPVCLTSIGILPNALGHCITSFA